MARPLLMTGIALVFLTGLVASAYGVWFIVSDQPFDSTGFADEFGMTRAETSAINPSITSWTIHVQDQIGSLSFGWGMFIMVIAATGLREGSSWARKTLWIAGLPTLAFSAFSEYAEFGTVDVGSISSMIAAALFLAGMGLVHYDLARAAAPRPAQPDDGAVSR